LKTGIPLRLTVGTAVAYHNPMFRELWQPLTEWNALHTWIALTAVLSAMACSLPGLWLVLRRQSLMGDALSHTALPGVVVSLMTVTAARSAGWVSEDHFDLAVQFALIVGAILMGMLTAALTEWLQNLSHVESSTALGVVFTGLFAVGLVLVRVVADDAHIDAECVLFGSLEGVVWDTWTLFGAEVPKAAVLTGVMLLLNVVLTLLFFKELRLASFDAELATTQGINARGMHYSHMALTAATVTAAFQSVGSILVIALLVVPAVTAMQLSTRLRYVLVGTLVIAAAGAILGHLMAMTIPPVICSRLGWTEVRDASTSGMVCVAAGILFLMASILGPRGYLREWLDRLKLAWQIAEEDLLGQLYRTEEATAAPHSVSAGWMGQLLLKRLTWRGLALSTAEGYQLTPAGQSHARDVVRRHRLWEAYMQKHFDLPEDHLHETAHRVEHYLDSTLQQALNQELDTPTIDPHGKQIPSP
jgi:manganese/zinc/iron transport system permease protein